MGYTLFCILLCDNTKFNRYIFLLSHFIVQIINDMEKLKIIIVCFFRYFLDKEFEFSLRQMRIG